MTTTLRPPPASRRPSATAPAPPGLPPFRAAAGSAGRHPAPSPLVAVGAEVALIGVSAAAVFGLARLFSDGSFVAPVLLAVVASHALAWVCRRRGIGILPFLLLSGLGLVLALVWLVEPHTTWLGIPGGGTWRAAVDDLRQAWSRFGDVKAPTAPLRGFVLVAVAAGWVAAAAADLFAFRMRARFEAMAPSFTLFVFGSILGADRLRLPVTALYLAAALAFILWSEAARRAGTGAWFAGRAREGDLALLRQGTLMGVAALVIALLVGPLLPGSGASGLVNWRDGKASGSRSRVTLSPLVTIRGRLVEQSNVELFTVRSSAPSYWRLTSLERFDGSIWSSLGTYQTTKGGLGGGPAGDRGRTLTQEYDIGPLGTIWLPAAFRPAQVQGVKGPRYDRDSSSLLAESETTDDLSYSVVSAIPELTAEELGTAPATAPPDVARRYLTLPEDFPDDVATEARRQTAGAVSPYEKARALQDWFRREFVYDTDIPAGHDVGAMQRFLAARRGYCEQFAGTYAAMARSIGLPARVAVGFVPGTPSGGGRYRVAGRDAHAWPEVYLARFGWVAFEPTPGRSAPGAESYTGVAPAPLGEQPEATVPTSAPPTTTAAATPPLPPEGEEEPEPATLPGEDRGLSRLVLLGLWSAGVLGLTLVGVPLGRRMLVVRRRSAAATPREQVLVAWREAEDALALAGHPRRPAETAGEFALRAGAAVGEAEPELSQLAGWTAAAGFSPDEVPAEAADTSRQAAEAVEVALRAQASLLRRIWWTLDPRPLLRVFAARVRTEA